MQSLYELAIKENSNKGDIYGIGLDGKPLERFASFVFSRMGLACRIGLPQIRCLDINSNVPLRPEEHMEFDFLIPIGDTCLVGEITSRSNGNNLRKKYYDEFLPHINFLTQAIERPDADIPNIWKTFGLTDQEILLYRDIKLSIR